MQTRLATSSTREIFAAVIVATYLNPINGPGMVMGGEPFQAQLRLLTHNVFGLNQDNCAERAMGFGHIVANAQPPYDLVGLNEHYDNLDGDIWTCDGGYLSDAMWCTGRYSDADQYYRYYPESFTRSDGGIGIFTTGSICEFYETQFGHNDEFLTAIQGIIFARVRLPNSTVTLDVYVTHLHSRYADDCPRCCRVEELERLRTVIRQHSARSGNPVLVLGDFNIGGPPSCCGNRGHEDIMSILGNPRDLWWEAHPCGESPASVCGDPFSGCETEVSLCDSFACQGAPAPAVSRCVDLAPSATGCGDVHCTSAIPSPSPFSPVECVEWTGWAGATWDQCLNELPDGSGRIDYIFLITDPILTSSAFDVVLADAMIADWTAVIDPPPSCPGCPNANCTIPPECAACDVLCPCFDCSCFECLVDDVEPYVGHVSDHLGVEATIQVFGRAAVWVDGLHSGRENGTSCEPFTSVQQGVDDVPVGDRVLVRAGRYPEPMRIGKPLTLQAIGGPVKIGL